MYSFKKNQRGKSMKKIILGLFLLLIALTGIANVCASDLNNATIEDALEIDNQNEYILDNDTVEEDNAVFEANFTADNEEAVSNLSDICLINFDDYPIFKNDSLMHVSGRFVDYYGPNTRIMFDTHDYDGMQVMACAYHENYVLYAIYGGQLSAHTEYATIENGEADFRLNHADLQPGPYFECYYLIVPKTVNVILPMKTLTIPTKVPVLIYQDSFIIGPWHN